MTNEIIEKKMLFVHTPRTGGTSVSTYLKNNGVNLKVFALNRPIPPRINLKNHYVFTIARNPVDRYVDSINFLLSGETRHMKFARDVFKYMNISIDLDLIKFVVKSPDFVNLSKLFIPQTNYTDKVAVDKIYKFEDGLSTITDNLRENFNLPDNVELEHLNAAPEVFTVDMLTEEQKQLLNKLYKSDFALYSE